MTLEPIFENDWNKYEWVEVSELGRDELMYIRGKRITPPPVDGYHYERSDTVLDDHYIWKRVYEVKS